MTRDWLKDRVTHLNDHTCRTRGPVIYWMQQSQRASHNHALSYACLRANEYGCGLEVLFVLTPDYPEANIRHYTFMLEGLSETRAILEKQGIPLRFVVGPLPESLFTATGHACLVVCDRGYLRHQRRWRRELAEHSPCTVLEVDADTLVPVDVASPKREYMARTLRPKLGRLLSEHQALPAEIVVEQPAAMDTGPPVTPALLDELPVDRSVPPVSPLFPGGATAARRRLQEFLDHDLGRYRERNPRTLPAASHLSMYLHFGQIAPVEVAHTVRQCTADDDNKAAFLEQLIVRRELAINYVWHTPEYDHYTALPSWARQTLEIHRRAPRPQSYTAEDLAAARTHDPIWNRAMNEMKHTGYMHSELRMYWGKKILEWMDDPAEAHHTILTLNNRWFLDGRDPSSYAGAGWICGLHDRPWPERPIYGTVRSMGAAGLRRKMNVDAYLEHGLSI